MKCIFLFALSVTVCAQVVFKDDRILPFEVKGYPLVKLYESFSVATGARISAPSELLNNKLSVSMYIRKEMSFNDFVNALLQVSYEANLNLVETHGGYHVTNVRDVRYMPTPVYSSEQIPVKNFHTLVFHKMKHRLSDEAVKSLRPFMSRFGRVSTLDDGYSLLIADKANNIQSLVSMIDEVDTSSNMKHYTDNKIKEAQAESKKTLKKKTIEELEREIVKLKERVEFSESRRMK